MSFFSHRRSKLSMKRFYNWFSRFYVNIEKYLFEIHGEIINDYSEKWNGNSALEYACGTGAWTSLIAPNFKHYRAKDLSENMLQKARQKAISSSTAIEFMEGDILNINEEDNAYDYVFISFAIHLFSPEQEENIIRNLIRVAKKRVVIIDHARKWSLGTALVEWLEGSFYDQYISIDFKDMAERLGIGEFTEDSRENFTILTFEK